MSRTRLAFASASSLAVVGGAVGIGCALSATTPVKYSLRSLIADTNRNILDQKADTWEIKYKTYEKFVKPKKQLNLSSDNAEGLKRWCQETINEETELEKRDSSNYSIALRLCTKPIRSERLLNNNKTLVEEGFWGVKAVAYNRARGQYTIPTLGNEVSPEEIENWCNGTVEQEITKNEDNTDKLAEKWCSHDL